jgi:SWIM zinc finger
MPVAVPKIGSRVRVTTRDKDYYVYATKEWRDTTYEGVVEKSIFSDPFYFAVRTGNPNYPVSEFSAKSERLVKIEYITGSATQVSTETKAWKIQSKDKIYLVTRIGGKFNCTCKGFEFRRDCKHIGAVGKK